MSQNNELKSQEYRIEKDTMGDVKVPAHALWGARTLRSTENFKIGNVLHQKSLIDQKTHLC